MQTLENIRAFYQPIQPTTQVKSSEILYQEILPTEALQSYIHCFWQLKSNHKLSYSYNYLVVADGCMDIFFDRRYTCDSTILGFCRRYIEFPIGEDFDYIGIRFLPAAFPMLFGIDAKTLSNQSHVLNSILPDFSNWIATTLQSTKSFENILTLLNSRLLERVDTQGSYLDWRFYHALILIFKEHGFLNTETDLSTNLSSRQLRRIFNFYIGTTPKEFSNVVRFQYILNATPSKQTLKNDKLYLDLGFFDQAHFIKSFKSFYGITPSKAFL